MTDVTRQPASPVAAQLARTFTLDNGRLFAVAVALSVAPLWFGSMLPLVDMPQHAAQIVALHEMWTGNETFLRVFEINWFTPYLLGYLLLYAIALVVPVNVATQVLATLAVASIPLLTGRLLRVAGADERWKWLAIPAVSASASTGGSSRSSSRRPSRCCSSSTAFAMPASPRRDVRLALRCSECSCSSATSSYWGSSPWSPWGTSGDATSANRSGWFC
jgi:hypothetical protein